MPFISSWSGLASTANARGGEVPEKDIWHPLSFIQRSFWFQYRLQPEMQGSSNPVFCVRVHGRLDLDHLSCALNLLACRHPMLRACFREKDGEPGQRIVPAVNVPIKIFDTPQDDDASLQERIAADFAQPFDLRAAPLIRAIVYRLSNEQYVLFLMFEHLICDGWSFWRLIEELGSILDGSAASLALDSPGGQKSYLDYVDEQSEWLKSAKAQKQLAYWRDVLKDECPVLNFPEAKPLSPESSSQRELAYFSLPAELSDTLKTRASKYLATPYMVLLAGYLVLLYKLTGEDHISAGSLMPARGGGEWDGVTGAFINLAGVRVAFDPALTVSGLLCKIRGAAIRAMVNQDYPFAELVEQFNPRHGRGQKPYFQTLFGFQNPRGAATILELRVRDKDSMTARWGGHDVAPFWRAPNSGGEAYALALDMAEFGGCIHGKLNYAVSMFDAATIARYIGYYKRILAGMMADEDQLVGCLPLLDESQRGRLIAEWAPEPMDYPGNACVHELIEAQAACTPGAIAVMLGDVVPGGGAQGEEFLTYEVLNTRASLLAVALREAGVSPGAFVGICAGRNLGMVVGLLAVWKAGGAYVPLDPAYPPARLGFMLEDSAPAAILTDAAGNAVLAAVLPGLGQRGIAVLDLTAERTEKPVARHGLAALETDTEKPGPRSLAYVIYTSGSTGKPKGVMVEHASVVNILWSLRALTDFGVADRILALTSIGFDIAGVELWLPLICGGRTVLAAPGASRDPALLSEALERSEITVMQATPAAWLMLVDWGWRGRAGLKALSGGEALPLELAARLRERVGSLWNVYGPSETTIWSSAWPVEPDRLTEGVAPLGLPLANTRIYILDAAGEPVPFGVRGEIYIGGAGVARGYLHRPGLTVERFLPDPFVAGPEERMYRTGDLGRRLADGTLGFLGRGDFQVKLRGFRIELGEIEARILAHPGIGAAVVTALEDGASGRYLAAYYTAVAESGAACPEAEDLRAHIGAALPDYMVPAAYMRLEQMPLTPNGKLDRAALPAAGEAPDAAPGRAVPVGALEEALAGIWARLLKVRQVGRGDDFFVLGGTSLLAVRLITRIREELKLDVPLATLFAQPSLGGFAAAVEATVAGGGTSLANPHIISFGGNITPRPNGAARPAIFAIAEALIFMPLAKHLGQAGQPFFVLRALETELSQVVACRSLEAIASFYVDLLRRAQPDGPYILLGFCSEGVLAFEMARQLGGQTALAILVDAWAPGHHRRLGPIKGLIANLSYRWRRKLWHLRRHLPGVPAIRRPLYILRMAPVHAWMKRQIARRVLQQRDSAPARIHDHIDAAARHYQPKLHEFPILLIRGENQPHGPLISPTLGWSDFVSAPIEIAEVPGDHDEMFAEPKVNIMARAIREAVDCYAATKTQASEPTV